MKTTILISTGLVLMLGGCGGSGPRHQPTEKYFLVCTNSKIPYWQEAGAGLVAAARELKVQAELVGPEGYDANAERDEFRRVVGKKPAGILVSPGNPEIMKPEIDAAMAAGIPVITIDSDSPQSNRLFFVGTNNYQAGQLGGKWLGKLLNGKGTVVFFTIAGQANLAERLNGYQAALAEFPAIKATQVVDMKGDPRLAFDTTTAMVEKKANIDAFVSLESLSGSEIAEVLQRQKVTDKVIVAMDTAPTTLAWIEKGVISATIMQKPFTMGYYGLRALAEIVLDETAKARTMSAADPQSPYPMFIDTGTMLVDKSNLAELKK